MPLFRNGWRRIFRAQIESSMRSTYHLDIASVRVAADADISLPVMVSSHERSGTHFLINAIAPQQQLQKRSLPRLRYHPLGSFHNFNDRRAVRPFFERLEENKCASVIKSHFAAQFFVDDDGQFLLKDVCKTLYILRDPVDVMLSYCRLLNFFPWDQGPKRGDAIEFLGCAPEGRMLRYQRKPLHGLTGPCGRSLFPRLRLC